MIVFKPIIENIADFQRGNLPENAIRLNTPPADKIMQKIAPLFAIPCVLLSAAGFLRTFLCGKESFSPLGILPGVVIGLVLILVHEWLHAIVYPKEAVVTIGKPKGMLILVALGSYPMKRGRFIFAQLLPFVLGIIPITAFAVLPAKYGFLCGVMFGAACIGLCSPMADVYNVCMVLKQSHKTDLIMFYEDDIFRIPQN